MKSIFPILLASICVVGWFSIQQDAPSKFVLDGNAVHPLRVEAREFLRACSEDDIGNGRLFSDYAVQGRALEGYEVLSKLANGAGGHVDLLRLRSRAGDVLVMRAVKAETFGDVVDSVLVVPENLNASDEMLLEDFAHWELVDPGVYRTRENRSR